ncbi:MAG: ATP-binding protein [Dehalococcoidia bacterium]
MASTQAGPIVVPENFIQATRDSGYRGLASALAELIDNSIDAGATEVDVRIREQRHVGAREITISVLDNGSGMGSRTLRESLRFGGSERFNGRTSLGRYGMGLPNSSVSQARRVDVFTWMRGGPVLRAHLDVDEITQRRASGVAEPCRSNLPEWVATRPASGTLVQWSRCDRLRFKKASTLAQKLRPALGRIYRRALGGGLVIRVNETPIAQVDPLLRTPVEGLEGTCEFFGEPLEYRIRTPEGGVSLVSVQFVELPVSRWYDLPLETKRAAGIVGGAGLSVLRVGREIDFGWHFFGGKRRENYDDWWRAELTFDPALDELVGITHSKQGINPAPELRDILEPDLERVARTLNVRVRRAFARVRPAKAAPGAKRASTRDRLLPPVQLGGAAIRRPTGAGFRFRIGVHEEATPEFFTVDIQGSTMRLSINQNHPFYEKLYLQAADGAAGLDVLLLAAARALFDLPEDARRTLLRSWSDNLLAYLSQ